MDRVNIIHHRPSRLITKQDKSKRDLALKDHTEGVAGRMDVGCEISCECRG